MPDLTASSGIANGSIGQPWNATVNSLRMQQLYGPGEFPYSLPMTITRIRFRPRDFTPQTVSWTGGTYQMQIRMSTTPLVSTTLTSTYAANHGGNLTTVHSGSVQVLPGNGNNPGPSAPYVDLALTTPFVYDPAQGSLLVDFTSDGSLYAGGSCYFPAAALFGTQDVARVWNVGSTTAASGTLQVGWGLVMEFEFGFVGTVADFVVDRTGAPTGSTLQFTDRSITSGAGGILAWAWDLDGDGMVDSNLPNPSFLYASPGVYGVSLAVTSATSGGPVTRTRAGLVTIADPVPSVPDLLQFQFNEVRGDRVANTATGSLFPPQGTVSNLGWQGDPGVGRDEWNGNEAGFGTLARSGLSNQNWVDSGGSLTWTGSLSVAWWQRLDALAPSNPFGYVFGGPGSTFAAYNSGGAYKSILFQGAPATGDLLCTRDIQNSSWVHLCVVVDDALGRVRWFVDGIPSGEKAFPPNTHTCANTSFLVGKHQDVTYTHARFYDTDDFRVYGRALGYGEVLGAMAGENASAGLYGNDCWAFGAQPTIGAIGRPTMGNAGFAINFSGGVGNANLPLAVPVGFRAAAGLPFDLTASGFFCGNLEVGLDLLVPLTTDGQGDAVVPLPVPLVPALAGLHAYSQFLSLAGVTKALDLNLQLR